jgi:hypothetical protein
LFVALGGTGYAAFKLPKNSVGTKQIKRGAVRSTDVKDGALLAKDFKVGQIPKGPKGDTGLPGSPGTPGAAGATNAVVRSENFEVAQNSGFSATVACHDGERAVGGGAGRTNGSDSGTTDEISTSVPANKATGQPANAGGTPNAWNVVFRYSGTGSIIETASVVCVSP